MKVLKQISQLKEAWQADCAFVPTMGALHEGHLSLVDLAKEKSSQVVMSIFLNPLQFNSPADLESYPVSFEEDLEKARARGVDLLFTPDYSEVYPADYQTNYQGPDERMSVLCGAGRPGHFEGVLKVVERLFDIVKPKYAVFGEKDFQQLRLIERMVSDLELPIEIIRGALVRDENGLALSSRNRRLDSASKNLAKNLSIALSLAKEKYLSGITNSGAIIATAKEHLDRFPELEVEYLEIRDEKDLALVDDVSRSNARIFVAASIGNIRLIDNLSL